MLERKLLTATAILVFTASPALAEDAAPAAAGAAPAAPAAGGATGSADAHPADIVVTAKRLDAARAAIQPSLGATAYTVTNATIQALPGGDNQQFNQILLQLPGVVQDGFGQFHVRDDHNNLQYRINGTILPEGLAVFGQTLSPRFVEKFNLLTGALPAQYGLRTAGIIDVTTKGGLFANGGSVSVYGGSHGTIEPSVQYGGSTGATNYFFSADYRHDRLGIENVDDTARALHDKTDQVQLFGYADHIIDDANRVSILGGYSNQFFQIPNPRGLSAATDGQGYSVGGVTDYASEDLDERQLERTGFGQLALLHHSGPFTLQLSLYGRYSALIYRPDALGELLFNGLAQRASKRDLSLGGQFDAAYEAGDAHTIRGGIVVSRDRGTSRTATEVFPVTEDGAQTGEPFAILDAGGQTEWTYSAYLQDEWKLTPTVTFNFGGRFDYYTGYRSEHQFSPRANIVWQPTQATTVHAGYARYFSPAPFELVASQSIARFSCTSAAAPGTLAGCASGMPGTPLNTTPFAERQNYFDVGFQQKLSEALTFGVDGYYRRSHNLIDEGQFGAPIILTPFNYRRGKIKGVETNVSFTRNGLLIYGNFAYAQAKGKDIVSSQFSFDPADLDYIQTHYIYLDHDQTYTASAGLSYAFKGGALAGLKLGGDMIYGSGLRADGAVPNGAKLDPYAQFNLSSSYALAGPGLEVRFDVINVGDHKYEIRDGSGIGVGAPQFGPRRGFFVGLSKSI